MKRILATILTAAMITSINIPVMAQDKTKTEKTDTKKKTDTKEKTDTEEKTDADKKDKKKDESDSELGDDIFAFKMKIDGELVELPTSYADFTSQGWNMKEDDNYELAPNYYSTMATFKKVRRSSPEHSST